MYSERCRFIGSGPRKVIALHGWFSDRHAYKAIWRHLDREKFTWAFLDWRGYGTAKSVPGSHTMDEVAGDVIGLADELGWSKFYLVGHSMGGKAIQRVLSKVPTRVEAMAGISPVPAGEVPFDEEGWSLFSGAAEDPSKRRQIIDMTTGNRLPAKWLDSMVQWSLACSDKEAFGDYLLAWAKYDFSHEVEGSETRFLVVAGEHDPALGPETMRQTILTAFKNASLVSIAEAGHYAADETPLALVSTIEGFFLQ
jgi:pimeloyl-ACP methyl ester carboxylesterase